MNNIPILDFDPELKAIIDPKPPKTTTQIPSGAVICFFRELLNEMETTGQLRRIAHFSSEIGPEPVYLLEKGNQKLVVFHPGVGAPLAGGRLEEAIAMGISHFIACGGCGVLDPQIAVGFPTILTAAVRDEGTSYHYLPASLEVTAHPRAISALETVFKARNFPYRLGKSWTTDAIYRETPQKRVLRLEQGCTVVEMEASAFFAIAQYRGVEFGQVVYGGDLVVPEGWDERGIFKRYKDRQFLFWQAVKDRTEQLCHYTDN
jgi:uridine phosphorylase